MPHSLKNKLKAQKNACHWSKSAYQGYAQYARACGRVSVGGDPDKRPVNRPLKDRQPEANRRTPPNGGRDLKQRRTGLFWSLPALQRPAYRRGLSILPGVRKGISPSKRWPMSASSGASLLEAHVGNGAASDRADRAALPSSASSAGVAIGGSTTPFASPTRAGDDASPPNACLFRRGETRALRGMPR